MGVRDLIAERVAELLESDLGWDVIYTPPGGAAQALRGIFDGSDLQGDLRFDAAGQRVFQRATVDLLATVSIDDRGTIQVNGDTWNILGKSGEDAYLITWDLQEPEYRQVRKTRVE